MKKEEEPIQLILTNFLQGNDHKKAQAGHISNVQEKQHLKGQQPFFRNWSKNYIKQRGVSSSQA